MVSNNWRRWLAALLVRGSRARAFVLPSRLQRVGEFEGFAAELDRLFASQDGLDHIRSQEGQVTGAPHHRDPEGFANSDLAEGRLEALPLEDCDPLTLPGKSDASG